MNCAHMVADSSRPLAAGLLNLHLPVCLASFDVRWSYCCRFISCPRQVRRVGHNGLIVQLPRWADTCRSSRPILALPSNREVLVEVVDVES